MGEDVHYLVSLSDIASVKKKRSQVYFVCAQYLPQGEHNFCVVYHDAIRKRKRIVYNKFLLENREEELPVN